MKARCLTIASRRPRVSVPLINDGSRRRLMRDVRRADTLKRKESYNEKNAGPDHYSLSLNDAL